MLPLIRFISSMLNREPQTNGAIDNTDSACTKTLIAEKDPEEDALLRILEQPDDLDDDDDDDDINSCVDDVNLGGPQCFQNSGTITSIGVLDGVIDNIHRFQLKDAPDNIRLGQTVEYLAFQPSANDDIIVRKIIKITDELWSGSEDGGNTVQKNAEDTKKKKEIFVRHKVCFLSKRVGREVFIDPPGDYSFNLDNVKISFIPIQGDWLTVVVRVEESEDSLNGCGEILEIIEVMPLRFKSIEGVISHWKTDQKMGIINRETFFTLDACEIGYVPVVGDEIDAHVIESQQGMLSWRALKVIPAIERTSFSRKNDNNFMKSIILQSPDTNGELLKNKYGMSISLKCSFGKLQFGKERDMIVELKNSSKMIHHLVSFGFCNKFQSQMKLMEPDFKNRENILINCNETVKFVFRCQAKFFGTAEELFVWNFKAFNIGRFIKVEVDDDYVKETKNQTYQKKPKKEIDRENLIPTKNGFIVNGVRPLRKAPFIPVKLGVFRVPDQFWEVMADNKSSSNDIQLRLLSSIPCLNEELTVGNYEVRWHSLLFVEEVYNVLQLRQYDMSRVLFRRCGEYLVLDVPGVMEKRPSLIVGDAAYVTHPDSASDQTGIKYEGFIHKIVRNDLFIKFNPTFHNTFDDKDYNVSFLSNRLAYRKCHQAINVAYKNLTSNWLFPSSLRPSHPLFILEDADEEKQNEASEGNENVVNSEEHNDLRSIEQPNVDNHRGNEGKNKVNGSCEEISPNPPQLSNGFSDVFDKLANCVTNVDLENRQLNPSISNQQKHLSPNLKDSIFNMSLKKSSISQNHNMVGAGNANNINEMVNTNQSGLSSPPRISVADWLLRNTQVNKRRDLRYYLNSGQTNSDLTASQTGEQTLPFTGQIKTLEEVEKQMLMNSPPKNMVTLSEIEKPLLNKSNINSKVIEIKENREKINWDEDCNRAKVAATKDVRVEEEEFLVKKSVRWFNKRLNHYQKEAVRRILRNEARPLPYIIFGPPGTGKTITLVETALQILFLRPESRLLIGTPSNSAADCIAEKLIDTGIFPVGTLVRLCSVTYFTNDRCSDKLAPYCTTPEYRVVAGDQTFISEDGLRKSTREALGRHRVTVGTCVTLGSLYNMGFPQGHFTHVLVDEAGQATEPETLVPLCFLDNKTGQSVLVGDPQQLGPVTFSLHAKNLGLGQSLIARLLDTFPYCRDVQSFPETQGFDPRLVTQLIDNYRSLPEILKLPSQMFYEDRLVPHVTENGFEASVLNLLKSELPQRNADLPPAMVFHGVKGVNYQEEDSPSWFNPQEVVQTVAYVNKLYQYGLTCDDIGIITPYNKQAFKIRQLLTKLEVNLPKVGSVEEFQGQERLVILLSTVRTTRKLDCNMKQLMGFISSPQRLNVGLTRARALLIIMGNPHLLTHDPYWRTVLDYCINNNAYCGCDAPDKSHNEDEPIVDINDPFAGE